MYKQQEMYLFFFNECININYVKKDVCMLLSNTNINIHILLLFVTRTLF